MAASRIKNYLVSTGSFVFTTGNGNRSLDIFEEGEFYYPGEPALASFGSEYYSNALRVMHREGKEIRLTSLRIYVYAAATIETMWIRGFDAAGKLLWETNLGPLPGGRSWTSRVLPAPLFATEILFQHGVRSVALDDLAFEIDDASTAPSLTQTVHAIYLPTIDIDHSGMILGRLYRFECSADLETWVPIGEEAALRCTRLTSVRIDPAQDAQFYRIVEAVAPE